MAVFGNFRHIGKMIQTILLKLMKGKFNTTCISLFTSRDMGHASLKIIKHFNSRHHEENTSVGILISI